MGFKVPTFNLTARIWSSATPITSPPRLTVTCQLRAAGKQSTGQDAANDWVFLWSLLVPALTDIRDIYNGSGEDKVECPAMSGRIYRVKMVDDVAKGFANEYRIAFLQKIGSWLTPIP